MGGLKSDKVLGDDAGTMFSVMLEDNPFLCVGSEERSSNQRAFMLYAMVFACLGGPSKKVHGISLL